MPRQCAPTKGKSTGRVLIDGALMPTIDQYLDNFLEALTCKISYKEDEYALRRRSHPSTDPRSVNRGVIGGNAILLYALS